MPEGKALIAGFLASVATGRMTVYYLQRQLADGQAFVERVGAENVNHELLVTLAAMESAINLIEAERLNIQPAQEQFAASTIKPICAKSTHSSQLNLTGHCTR